MDAPKEKGEADDRPMTGPSADKDRWLIWPVVASVAVTAVLTFLSGLPGVITFVLIPLSLFFYAVAATVILILSLFLAATGRLRKSSSALVTLGAPVLLWPAIYWMTIYLHLALMVGFGMGTIGPKPDPAAPFRVYDWSTGLAGGPATLLIRDETDEIALSLAEHKHGFGKECAGKASHLIGHYYLCTF
jgi:hypothetical protein